MTLMENKWFTEEDPENGSAFSLGIRETLHTEQSRYQRIDIYATEKFGKLMVIDGFVMLSERDNFIYHEMLSHPALFIHQRPCRVAIIGGGDCGTLREVLKHSRVEHVLQVEIDERVTRLAEQYFPELCEANHDPRAEFLFGDGIEWMRKAPDDSLDVIIVDSTDPIGPAEGLFGETFYRECMRVLAGGGILVQQSESPLYHLHHILKPMHRAMRASGFTAVRSLHFPQCVYPSGWWSATLARKGASLEEFRETEAGAPPFPTRYYNLAVHRGSFALPEFVRQVLEQD